MDAEHVLGGLDSWNGLAAATPAGLTFTMTRTQPVRPRRAPGPGRVWGARLPAPSVVYLVYANSGLGDPINYAAPVAVLPGLSWQTYPLSPGGSYAFAVRAQAVATGLVETNVDCALAIVLGPTGADISLQPNQPTGLRIVPLAGGSILVQWAYLAANRATSPLGFRVYAQAGTTPQYQTPAATVPYAAGQCAYSTILAGPTGGGLYTVGVRAYNAVAEESNTNTATASLTTTGPSPVDALAATAS